MSYVDFCCSEDAEFKRKIIEEKISSGNEFVDLIKDAESDLISTDDEARSKAIEFVSILATNFKDLSGEKRNFLFDFLLCKLSESLALPVLVPALTHLVFELPDKTSTVLKVISANFNIKNEKQSIRILFYELCSKSLNYSVNFSEMDLETLLEIIDGEKDPRNLCTVFTLLSMIGSRFPDICRVKIDKFLGASFCYFPIVFTPPPNDPHGITQELLKTNLEEALFSCKYGLVHLLWLLLDKLSSSYMPAKFDSYEMIKKVILTLEQKVAVDFISMIAIKIVKDDEIPSPLNVSKENQLKLKNCRKTLLECLVEILNYSPDLDLFDESRLHESCNLLDEFYEIVKENVEYVGILGCHPNSFEYILDKISERNDNFVILDDILRII